MHWAQYMKASYTRPKGQKPVVVLGHGFGCDSTCWHNLKPLLAKRGYGILTYDLPYARTVDSGAFDEAPTRRSSLRAAFEKFLASGAQSSKVVKPTKSKPFDFERYSDVSSYAEDLIRLFDEAKLKACVFVGHSVSGMIGLIASTRRPDLFQKVIMLASSPRYLNDASSNYVGGFEREQMDELLTSVEHHYEEWVSGFAPMAIEEPNDAAIKQFTSGLLAVRPDIAFATCKAILLMDTRHILPHVSVSCVIIQSKSDVAVPVCVGAYLADTIQNAERIILPTAGHLPHLSSPLIVNATLLQHIGRTADGAEAFK